MKTHLNKELREDNAMTWGKTRMAVTPGKHHHDLDACHGQSQEAWKNQSPWDLDRRGGSGQACGTALEEEGGEGVGARKRRTGEGTVGGSGWLTAGRREGERSKASEGQICPFLPLVLDIYRFTAKG